MLYTRERLEQCEDHSLARYGFHSRDSQGRAFPEAAPPYRTRFQRDRDRILHTDAFRRLEYKTQVFVNHEGDLFRTRLTHSIEVAQVARSIARALQLNEDLTEGIALAHDLGHTPFGHAGQDALNACMQSYGGFEHNLQSLRVVDELEYLNSLNFHQINIADDLFTANKKHCLAVCNEIIRRGLTLKWTSFARVDTVSKDLLATMKSAGCEAVSFGIESANPDILKTIQKGITLPQVVNAVKMCQQVGIIPYASFILGLPGETPQTIKDTLDFGERLKEQGMLYGFHLLAPFPGTEIR